MPFKDYFERGSYLHDVRRITRGNYAFASLEHPVNSFTFGADGDPERRLLLFSVTSFLTSLIIQAVGKLYGEKAFDLGIRVCRWPHLCGRNRDEVSPLQLMRVGGFLPTSDTETFIEHMYVAEDYFLSQFKESFSESDRCLDPVARNSLMDILDFPVLEKEVQLEVDFMRDWLRREVQDPDPYYMPFAHPLIYSRKRSQYICRRAMPVVEFPKNRSLAVTGSVTLHSRIFKRQLEEMTFELNDLSIDHEDALNGTTPKEELEFNRKFLGGEMVSTPNNRVLFKMPCGMFRDVSELQELLKDAVLKTKTTMNIRRYSPGKDYSFRIKPETVSVNFIPGSQEHIYEGAMVTFESECRIMEPWPIIPLEHLETPYIYDSIWSAKHTEYIAYRAILEYGKELRIEEVPKFSNRWIVKVPHTMEAMEKAFFYETFLNKPLTLRYFMDLLEEAGVIQIPPLSGEAHEKYSVQMTGHHRVWDKIVRDLKKMEYTAIYESPEDENVQLWLKAIQKTLDVVQNALVPMEKEVEGKLTYGKRKKSMVSRVLNHYLFQRLLLTPTSFVDSEIPSFRKYSQQLIAGVI